MAQPIQYKEKHAVCISYGLYLVPLPQRILSTHQETETHGCVLGAVATDVLVNININGSQNNEKTFPAMPKSQTNCCRQSRIRLWKKRVHGAWQNQRAIWDRKSKQMKKKRYWYIMTYHDMNMYIYIYMYTQIRTKIYWKNVRYVKLTVKLLH